MFEIGDVVSCEEFGEGIIDSFDYTEDGNCPMQVIFGKGTRTYTVDGYYTVSKRNATGWDAYALTKLEKPMNKLQCTTPAEVFEQFARVSRLVEGTKLKLKDVFKYNGCPPVTEIISHLPRSEKYSFALAIVEGKPVFAGDTLYVKNKTNTPDKVTVTGWYKTPCWVALSTGVNDNIHIDCLTWQEPKRTFMLNGEELPLPDDINKGTYSSNIKYHISAGDFEKYRWDSAEDRNKVLLALQKLLSAE
jgi:hypothetical protein